MSNSITAALDALAGEGFSMGPAWKAAHQLAQAHEGDPVHDRLHALCHRMEGDDTNAAYWYRRAGVSPFEGEFADEAAAIRAILTSS